MHLLLPYLYSCWLSYDNGAIWAFAGPVAGIVLVSFFTGPTC